MIGKDSFKNANKPPLTPPDFLFPIVLTILLWLLIILMIKWVTFAAYLNIGFAEYRSGIEILLTLNSPLKNKKVYSIFSKIAGLGSAHKNLPILQFFGRKQLRCLRACTEFEKTGGSFLEKNLLIYCLMNGFLLLSHF